MDNTQAAAVLRGINVGIDHPDTLNIEAALVRGADALEILEWLFENVSGKEFGTMRAFRLYSQWDGCDSFLAYCETRFEESKKGLAK